MEFMENDEQIVEYPLSKFKETASYKNNINILFNSKNDKLNVKRQENILKNIRIVRKK